MPTVKPQDFSTKQKHLHDRGKENVGIYATNPIQHLPHFVTGQKMTYGNHGIVTTGQHPPGLSAYTYENGRKVPCDQSMFVWNTGRFYPFSHRYFIEQVLPRVCRLR